MSQKCTDFLPQSGVLKITKKLGELMSPLQTSIKYECNLACIVKLTPGDFSVIFLKNVF